MYDTERFPQDLKVSHIFPSRYAIAKCRRLYLVLQVLTLKHAENVIIYGFIILLLLSIVEAEKAPC